MKTCYIAGPMRGIKLYNFPAFDAAQEFLESHGWDVINPAEIDRKSGVNPSRFPDNHDWDKLPEGMKLDAVITRDVSAVRASEAVFALPGWESSTGARAEIALALWAGKTVYEYEGNGEITEVSVVITEAPEDDGYRHLERGELIPEGTEYYSVAQNGWVKCNRVGGRQIYSDIYRVKRTPPPVSVLADEKIIITTAEQRKKTPVYSGVFCYFPLTLEILANTWTYINSSQTPFCLWNLILYSDDSRIKQKRAATALCLLQEELRPGTRTHGTVIQEMESFVTTFRESLEALARLSQVGNDQHNPGEPLHWNREKSADHMDCAVRHLMDAGTVDTDGVRHTTKVCWRLFCELELHLEKVEGHKEAM